MRIFCDFHHGALARSMFYLFCDRLGHDFSFMDVPSTIEAGACQDGTWGCPNDDYWTNHGISEDLLQGKFSWASYADFKEGNFDVMILSRPESRKIYHQAGHPKPGIIYIGVSGNEGTHYDWNWVKNFLATDIRSFDECPDTVHKINTPQELGRHFDEGFVPIKAEDLGNISTFTNNLKGFDTLFQPRNIDYPVNIYQLWLELKALMPHTDFTAYGHGNHLIGGESIIESALAPYYHGSSLIWNFKTCDGYGHSVLQSLPSGRIPLVPIGFFDDRMAGRYLREDEGTCIECSYNPADMADAVREYTSDLDTANERALRCYESYKRLMNWEAEAERVREWLEGAHE